jgi:glycosyltransferase involved in cell wall biosynthesis
MRIGVDGRLLLGQITGIGRYTFELSKKLIQIPNSQFSFYTPASVENEVEQGLRPSILKSASCHGRFSKMLWSQTKLLCWAAKSNIDLFWGPTHRLPIFLPKSIARVVTIHDLVWKFAPQTMRPLNLFVEKRLMPEAIRLADLVMADSQSTASGIAEVFPEYAHKVRVVHLGVVKSDVTSKSASLLPINIAKPYFLFVGTIEPRKNLERLLSAFALIPNALRDHFSFVIAGGKGWGGINLQELIQLKGLEDSVKVLGYVTDSELSVLYSNARFLAMPSIYEGFGLPLLEAMIEDYPASSEPYVANPEFIASLNAKEIRQAIWALEEFRQRGLREELLSGLESSFPGVYQKLKLMLDNISGEELSDFDMANTKYYWSAPSTPIADAVEKVIAHYQGEVWAIENYDRLLKAKQEVNDKRLLEFLNANSTQRAHDDLDRAYSRALKELRIQ